MTRPSDAELVKLCDRFLFGAPEPGETLGDVQDGVAIARALKSLITSEPEAQPTREEIARALLLTDPNCFSIHWPGDSPRTWIGNGTRESCEAGEKTVGRFLMQADAILALFRQPASVKDAAQARLTAEQREFVEAVRQSPEPGEAMLISVIDTMCPPPLAVLRVNPHDDFTMPTTSSQTKEPQQ